MAAKESPLPCLCLCICLFICICVLCVSDGKDVLRRWQQRNLPSPVCVCHKHPLAGSSQSQSVKHICFCLWSFATAVLFWLWPFGKQEERNFTKAGMVQIINSVFFFQQKLIMILKMFIQTNDGSVYFVVWGNRMCAMPCVCLEFNGNCWCDS